MPNYALWIDIDPLPKGRPRFSRSGHAFTDPRTRKYEQELASTLAKVAETHLEQGPLWVQLTFVIARPKKSAYAYPPRADVDNYAKAFCDAANGVLWEDDSQIVTLECCKVWGDKGMIIAQIAPLSAEDLETLMRRVESLRDPKSSSEEPSGDAEFECVDPQKHNIH